MRLRTLAILTIGLVGGVVLGIAARAWMRLISDDPEFTWSGTIAIVMVFAFFGTGQAVAHVTGRSTRRWALVAGRGIGTVGMLAIFLGPGAIMAPTVVCGGLAFTRDRWRRVTRWLLTFLAAAVPVGFVGRDLVRKFGWSLHAAAGFAVMVGLYAVVARSAGFTLASTHGRVRIPRRVIVGLSVVATGGLALLVAGMATS